MKRIASRLLLLYGLPNLVFVVLAAITPAPFLIDIFSGAILALAVGVCVAYFPVIREIVAHYRKIDRADMLALGIFGVWFAIILRTGWALMWRYAGQPFEWVDTHFIGYTLFLMMCAASFHLLAPGAIESRVPTADWLRVGALCTLGVAAMLFASWLLDAFPLAR